MSLAIPTLPPPLRGSTIGAGRLNDRVRDGNGCCPSAVIARDILFYLIYFKCQGLGLLNN